MRFVLISTALVLALASVQADNCWDRCAYAVQQCQSDARRSYSGMYQGSYVCSQILKYCLGTCYSDSLEE